jgi:hypothetical protein
MHGIDESPLYSKDVVGDAGPKLVEYLKDVGFQLLNRRVGKGKKWTKALCRRRALGYGGDAQMVVLSYNTPTGTVTALWEHGEYQGLPWKPLFPRRNR